MKRIYFVGLAMGFLFSWNAQAVFAGNVKFAQSILPIKVVNLNEGGRITQIWTNARYADGAYVLKTRQTFSEKNMVSVAHAETDVDVESLLRKMRIFEQERLAESSVDIQIEYVRRPGGFVEEVRTAC